MRSLKQHCTTLGLAAMLFAMSPLAWGQVAPPPALQAGLKAYQQGDYPAALKQLIPLANQGNAAAQLQLGLINELGQGVAKNLERAVMRYRQAADQGNAEAQYRLGRKYELGQGVTQSKTIALEWYKKSAAQDYAQAQEKVDAENRASQQAIAAELAYWKKVNAKREAEAQAQTNTPPDKVQSAPASEKNALQIGLDAYQQGDYPTALKQLIPLANKGDAIAQLQLGLINELGQGVAKNLERAVMRYRQAADQGNAEAQFHLGEKYELGQGVAQSKITAMEWYNKAAAQHYVAAQNKVDTEADKIAHAQLIAEANFRAAAAARAAEQTKRDAEMKARVDAERARAAAEERAIAQAKADMEAKRIEQLRIAAEKTKALQEAKLKTEAEQMRIVAEAKLKAEAQVKAEEAARAAKQAKLDAEAKALAQAKTDAEVKKVELAKLAAAQSKTQKIDTSHAPANSPNMLLERGLMDWATAWSNKNVPNYLSAYTPNFKPDNLSHETWKKQRTERVSKPKVIEVSLSNIHIDVQDESHASVSFTQHYRSDDYQDQVEKILTMVKRSDRWLIAKESVLEAVVKPDINLQLTTSIAK